MYHGVFVQDDWKVSDRLTVNLGLRYEYEGSTTEADNRNVNGFDPNASLAITAAAKAAYAANPIAQLPASAFNARSAGCCSHRTANPASGTRTGTTSSRASGSRTS